MNNKILLAFFIVTIVICFLFYMSMINPYVESEFVDYIKLEEEPKIKENVNNKNQLILFWANWCGHCKSFKPKWEESKVEINKKYPELEILDVNCDDFDVNKCHMLNNNKIVSLEGVPTIVLRVNNNDVEYTKDVKNKITGERSPEDLLKFCECNLNK